MQELMNNELSQLVKIVDYRFIFILSITGVILLQICF